MDQLQIELKYRWYPVYLREKVEYLFPMAISPHMRLLYKGPAVFKWEVFQKIAGDKKIVYIGRSKCVSRRYAEHLRRNKKDFNEAFFLPVPEAECDMIETELIKLYKPIYNRTHNRSGE